ncbi:MAG: ATP-binding cassette domain-containing protein [Spirochaetota bacterium]
MCVRFHVELPLREFDLRLEGGFENATVGVFGPSGAGKSTLFRLLAGLDRPQRGFVEIAGRRITDTERGIHVPTHRRGVGIVFQDRLLFPHLTIRENIAFGARYAKDRRVDVNTIAELLDLVPLLDAPPAVASGGEQQRAAIARAVVASPDLLLLDEPFSAIDSARRTAIIPYLRRLRHELGFPMLVVSHDLADIRLLTDTVYLVDRGTCRGFGRIVDLFTDAAAANKASLVNVPAPDDPRATDGSCARARFAASRGCG